MKYLLLASMLGAAMGQSFTCDESIQAPADDYSVASQQYFTINGDWYAVVGVNNDHSNTDVTCANPDGNGQTTAYGGASFSIPTQTECADIAAAFGVGANPFVRDSTTHPIGCAVSTQGGGLINGAFAEAIYYDESSNNGRKCDRWQACICKVNTNDLPTGCSADSADPFDVIFNNLIYTIQETGGVSCTESGHEAIASSYETITDHQASMDICEQIRILKGYSGAGPSGELILSQGWSPGGCFYVGSVDGLVSGKIYANGAPHKEWTGTKDILNFCIVSHSTNDPTCNDGYNCTAGSLKDSPEGITCTTGTCDDATCCDADPVKCATFSGCTNHLVLYDNDCPAGGCDTATCCATTFNSETGFALYGTDNIRQTTLIAVQQGCAAVGAMPIPSNKVVVGQVDGNENPTTGTIRYVYGDSLPDGFSYPNGGNLLFNGHEICFFCNGQYSDRYEFMRQLYGVDTYSADDFCNEVSTNHQCTQKSCMPPPPECTANQNGDSCLNGGTVTGTSDPNDASPCACACTDGYDGDRCENDIDDCASTPCLNGGSCTDGVDSFTCACAVGYEGNTCQDPKTCSLDGAGNSEIIACQNGGTANGQTGSCTCNCATGYDGNLCQNTVPCTTHQDTAACVNGVPTGSVADGTCICDCTGTDFVGTHCQTARACTLQDIPCANGMSAQGQYDANNPKHGGCTCDCMGTLKGFYCEVDTITITEGAVTTRKSTARAKADKKALRQDLKTIAKDLLAVKLTTEPDLKKAIRETRVVLEKDDFSFQMKKLLKENIQMAVGPTNDAAEQDDCQAAGAAADGSCGMLDLNADTEGELTLISTAGENSYTIVVDGNTVLSKQVQTQNGFDMQCWDTDDWGAATSYNLDELSPAEDRLFQCNGRIIIVGSQGALCTESSCSGNGACHPHGTSFICVCHSGYEGADCSVLNNGNSQNCSEAQTNNDRIAYQNLQCGCDC